MRKKKFLGNPTQSFAEEELEVKTAMPEVKTTMPVVLKKSKVKVYDRDTSIKSKNDEVDEESRREAEAEAATIREILRQQEAEEDKERSRRLALYRSQRNYTTAQENWEKVSCVVRTVNGFKKYADTRSSSDIEMSDADSDFSADGYEFKSDRGEDFIHQRMKRFH